VVVVLEELPKEMVVQEIMTLDLVEEGVELLHILLLNYLEIHLEIH
jgi:hypothetical protein